MKNYFGTYISISFLSYSDRPELNSGHMFISDDEKKLDYRVDIPYAQARREMAKLMLRLGAMPDVVGKEDNDGCLMYILTGFLN